MDFALRSFPDRTESHGRHTERLYQSLIEEAGTRPKTLYDTPKKLVDGLNRRWAASKEVQETRTPGAASRHFCAIYADLRVAPKWLTCCKLEAPSQPFPAAPEIVQERKNRRNQNALKCFF